ncbi:hypothetical protein ES703_24822 [subsurface metagenome]
MQQLETSRRQEVAKLKEAGLKNDAQIGRILGISRERARQPGSGKPTRPKSAPQPKSMLKGSDVARLLHVHINTVKRWSNQGKLKVYRISSRGDRRFWREDIDAFLEERKR